MSAGQSKLLEADIKGRAPSCNRSEKSRATGSDRQSPTKNHIVTIASINSSVIVTESINVIELRFDQVDDAMLIFRERNKISVIISV